MSDSAIYWIWLSTAVPYGSVVGKHLYRVWGGARGVFEADADKIRADRYVTPRIADAIVKKDLSRAAEILTLCGRYGVSVFTPDMPEYPADLLKIANYPLVLYSIGTVKDFNSRPAFASVGTREASQKGLKNAYEFGKECAGMGVTVVSGLALGIDTQSALGALDAGGVTVAVLGCGCDKVYPPQNKELYDRIIGNGAVVSEYPPMTLPYRTHFPERNRIISGMSLCTVVVESGEQSGSLITARYAVSHERPLFAYGGSAGTEALIAERATRIECAADVAAHLDAPRHTTVKQPDRPQVAVASQTRQTPAEQAPNPFVSSLDSEKQSVYRAIRGEMTVDEIIIALSDAGSTMSPQQIMAALTYLEAFGLIIRSAGAAYKRK